MSVNTNLKMVIVSCISMVFVINSLVHLNILMNDEIDTPAAFIGRILFVIIDCLMAVWLMYNINGEIDQGVLGLLVVHALMSPTNMNKLINSNQVSI